MIFLLPPISALIILCVIGIPAVILSVVLRKVLKLSVMNALALGTASSMAIIVLFGMGVIAFEIIDGYRPCNRIPGPTFHFFHGHLKDLCVERNDKSSCPRDASQLAAFSPQRWDELQQCSELTYSFDEQTDSFTFTVVSDKGVTMTASTPLNGGFTVNWLK